MIRQAAEQISAEQNSRQQLIFCSHLLVLLMSCFIQIVEAKYEKYSLPFGQFIGSSALWYNFLQSDSLHKSVMALEAIFILVNKKHGIPVYHHTNKNILVFVYHSIFKELAIHIKLKDTEKDYSGNTN